MNPIVDLDLRRSSFDRDDDPPAAPRRSGAPPARDVSELPELPGVQQDLLARATHATRPEHVERARVDTKDAAMQARVDAFFERAKGRYHTAQGDVTVLPAFRMVGGYGGERSGELAGIASKHGIPQDEVALVVAGRGSPEQVQRVTQALIDEGKLPATARDGSAAMRDRIRQMMFDYGVGFDCAGYTQQAALAAHGLDRAKAGFKTPTNENLSGLESRGWTKVPVTDVRLGDVVVLDPPGGREPGHTVIVSGEHAVSPADRATLPPAVATRLAEGHRVRAIQVDSSWGSGNSALRGGVERKVWYHDQTKDTWFDERGKETPGPYNHRLHGVFRPAVEVRS
jgi:hypothetical protein